MSKANGFLAVRIALALGLALAFILWVAAQYDPLADSDGDGLMEDEETWYGTDPGLWDTDGDGLSDFEELSVDFSGISFQNGQLFSGGYPV